MHAYYMLCNKLHNIKYREHVEMFTGIQPYTSLHPCEHLCTLYAPCAQVFIVYFQLCTICIQMSSGLYFYILCIKGLGDEWTMIKMTF